MPIDDEGAIAEEEELCEQWAPRAIAEEEEPCFAGVGECVTYD